MKTQFYKNIGENQIYLSEDEEISLFKQYKTASDKRKKEIENMLVCSALKAAYDIGSKFSKIPNVDLQDAVQEANIGILEAIKKYNENYIKDGVRVKFITFAYTIADKRVKDWIMKNSRLIRLPRSRLDKIFIILEAYKQLNFRTTSIDEIFEKTNQLLAKNHKTPITLENLYQSLSLLKIPASIHKPINNYKNKHRETLGDIIISDEPGPELQFFKKETQLKLLELLKNRLTEIELKIFKMRFFQDKPATFIEISKELDNITQERIRQIEKKALKFLKEDDNFIEALKGLVE